MNPKYLTEREIDALQPGDLVIWTSCDSEMHEDIGPYLELVIANVTNEWGDVEVHLWRAHNGHFWSASRGSTFKDVVVKVS